jgi:hypothetical protein
VLIPAGLLTPPTRVVPGGAFRACHKVVVSHRAYRLEGVGDGGRP